MPPSKILFVFPAAEAGGIATGLLGMARHLCPSRHRAIAAATAPGPLAALFRKEGIPCFVAPQVEQLKFFRALIAREGVRLVQSCDSASIGARAARSMKLPHVWYIGGRPEEAFSGPVRSIPYLKAWIGRLSNALIVQSRVLAEDAFSGFPKEKLHVIPWGVDASLSHPSRPRGWLKKRLGIRPADPLIALVGNYYPAKRHGDFLRAVALIRKSLPQVRFLIAGKTVGITPQARRESLRYQGQVLASIRRLGLRGAVTRTSFPAEERGEWYGEINLLLVPSIEGMGQAMLEAGAAGVPVVAVNAGGIPEVIQDGRSGLLVPYQNPQAMAQAAVQMIRNSSLANRLGRSLKKQILSNLTAEKQARRFEQLYETLLAEKPYPSQ